VQPNGNVFISHDTRDADLAKAFADLLHGASVGILKSFWSSDKSGMRGLPYGSEWYQALMTRLIEASDVVCLLTPFSTERPWVLYEAGVAKGRLDVSVYGVALGIPLSRASTGPFAQFQNCADDLESLTSLVIQLLRRIPDADPPRGAVQAQVETFKGNIVKILQDPSRISTGTEEEGGSGEKTIRMFEEIKAAIGGLPARDATGQASRELAPALFQQILHREQVEKRSPHGFLIIVGLLRDEFPWLFQLGLDVWSAKDDKEYSERVKRFLSGLDLTLNLPILAKQQRSMAALRWLRQNLRF
jgi:hypothetical protein